VHCAVSAFSAWTTCTKSCGTGSQNRARSVTTATRHGGYACPYLEETRNCNAHTCAVHCTVSTFSAWSTCTKSCGTGSQNRSRSVTARAAHGGYLCPYLDETRSCNAAACPVDCKFQAFSNAAWSTCTKSCGAGSQQRKRA